MIVDENKGDIKCTEKFQEFLTEMHLKLFVCRKADPETKGKIEAVIKFIKHNFLSARNFASLQEAETRKNEWLKRRANGRLSAATRRIPGVEIELERKHLRPLKASIFKLSSFSVREPRNVDSLCEIMVDVHKYPVSEKFCQKKVDIYQTEDTIHVFDPLTGEKVHEYSKLLIPGARYNDRHRQEGRKAKLDELAAELSICHDSEKWRRFVAQNFAQFPRYFRDQYHEAKRKFVSRNNSRIQIDSEILEKALDSCLQNECMTFAKLHDAYSYFLSQSGVENKQDEKSPVIQSNRKRKHSEISVASRSLDEYLPALQTGVSA